MIQVTDDYGPEARIVNEGPARVVFLHEKDAAKRIRAAKRNKLPVWIGSAVVEKREGDWTAEQIANGEAPSPYEIVHGSPQALHYGGASCIWECLIGNGVTTADQALTYFNNARAAIGVGDSTDAFDATENDLQAATNKLRKGMDATYPVHADGTASANAQIVFRATFTGGEANFQWNEWIVANSATAATGRALNRKVETLGTKGSGSTWTITVTLTLS